MADKMADIVAHLSHGSSIIFQDFQDFSTEEESILHGENSKVIVLLFLLRIIHFRKVFHAFEISND